jgi:PAS domain S-box-containing protein
VSEDPTTPWTEAKFRVLTLNSADIVSVLDAQGHLLYNSPAAERISGFSAEELAGVDTFQLIHPDDREEVSRAFSQVLAVPGGVVTVQYRYRRKSGGWTWMEAVASNQLDNPEVRGVVANSRDISDRKHAEEKRARMEAQLTHRQRLESLGTLVGGIAHEFNNLLSVLQSHVDLAAEATQEKSVQEELASAQGAIQRAAALTRQLLGFARLQPIHPTTVDVGDVLERLRPVVERLLGGQIEVQLSLPAEPCWIRIDPSHLQQILVNLATNARDAMHAGGHLLLELTSAPAGPNEPRTGVASLRVADDGTGMAPEVLARAFEPFFTTKAPGSGTGLGLAVTHGIVTQAGGTIQLESHVGAGTTAVLRFPLVAAPAPDTSEAQRSTLSRARPGERILLADDDDLVRRATLRLLARRGWEVDEARDGQEAVEMVASTPHGYAAAVLDVRMPRLGGPAAEQRLAEIAPGLAVVLISGYTEQTGLKAVLYKPFGENELAVRVRSAIDAKGATRSTPG